MYLIYLFFIFCLILVYYTKPVLYKGVLQKDYSLLLFLFYPFFVALFMGLRDKSIGLDSVVYLQIFNDPDSYPSKLEPGFLLFNKIVKLIFNNDSFYLFIFSYLIAFLQTLNYFLLEKKNCFYYLLIYTSFYYFYQFNFNIMREGLAITLVSLAFNCYHNKRYKSYIVLGILGCTIHITSLIFLFYPLFSIKIKNKKTQYFLFIILILLMFTNITSIIINSIPNFHWSIEKIKWYFYVSQSVSIRFPHLISLAIISLFTLNFESMKKSKFFYLYTFHTIFFVFLSVFHESVLVYDRFYFYLQVFEPILIYEFNILFKEKRIYNDLIILFIIFMSLFTIYIWGPRNFITPYKLERLF